MNGEEQLYQRYGRDCPVGTVLFRAGDPGEEMFVIHGGQVQISRHARDVDVEKVLATLGPGEFFGEMAIISNRPRTATAVVVEDARLLAIDARTFEAMVRGNAEIAVRLIRKFADRLAVADQQIETLLHQDPSSRVVHHLLGLLGEAEAGAGGGEVAIALATPPLPALLGVAAWQVEEQLERLSRAGICVAAKGGLLVKDPAELREYAEFLAKKEKFRALSTPL